MSASTEENLPTTWAQLTLDEVRADRSSGIIPSKQPNNKFELYSVPSFNSGKPEIVQGHSIGSSKKTVDTGTVLLCKINPRINRVWVVGDYSPYPKIASTEWIPFFRTRQILPKFLCYFMRSEKFRCFLASRASGVGGSLMRIKPSILADYSFPIAPIAEQARIVAKIDELFSELDKGVESLKMARSQLKVYRQAVLKQAFEGELTARWREENKGKLETAEQLFARIEQERAERIEQQLENWIAAVKQWKKQGKIGRRPKKPTHPKLIYQVDSGDVSRLPVLPKGWHWAPLAWLLSTEKVPMRTGPFGTMLKKHEHRDVGVPVLGIENIHEGQFIDGNKVFVSKEKAIELSAFEVEPEDLIISRSGTVGEICSVPSGLGKALMSTNLLRVSLNQHVVLSKLFVFMFQGGGAVRNQVKEQCKGSSREFLNQSILRSVIFPICSLAEQVQLVGEIEKRLSLADQLLGCIESELLRSNPLRHTILKNAFSGKLVEQDPSDEPAFGLLERINAEQTSQKPKTKPRIRQVASA